VQVQQQTVADTDERAQSAETQIIDIVLLTAVEELREEELIDFIFLLPDSVVLSKYVGAESFAWLFEVGACSVFLESSELRVAFVKFTRAVFVAVVVRADGGREYLHEVEEGDFTFFLAEDREQTRFYLCAMGKQFGFGDDCHHFVEDLFGDVLQIEFDASPVFDVEFLGVHHTLPDDIEYFEQP
jgi:hypothetical protein